MSVKKPSKIKGIISAIVAVIILAVAGWALLNRQYIIDLVNYYEYQPTSTIASFADKSSMNSEGKFLFYSAQPKLEESADFNKSCPNYSAGSMAILGCYDGQRIYIFNVTNTQLDGIREETAAYEMLHAAYKRIGGDDKKRLDNLIEAEYAKQANASTAASVAYFAKYEPGERDNELFSVIATQFAKISPDLEAYYSRFFTDRQVLVTLYNKYSSVFTNLSTQSTNLYNQITALNQKIETDKAAYEAASTQLQADINSFNQAAQSGNMTQSQYNSQRAALEVRINALSAERNSINDEITTVTNLVTQYQALALQVQQLNKSIDSTVTAAPSL